MRRNSQRGHLDQLICQGWARPGGAVKLSTALYGKYPRNGDRPPSASPPLHVSRTIPSRSPLPDLVPLESGTEPRESRDSGLIRLSRRGVLTATATRVLPTERAFLDGCRGPWRTNFGFHLTMSDRVDGEALGRSLVHAVAVHPKMAGRVRNGRWVEGPAPAPTELEDLPGCCDAFVDAPFDPEGEAPVRVAFDGKHILVACLHAATDANGLVGFCGTFLRLLAGIPESIAPVHTSPVLASRSAWTPATFRELRRLRAPTLRRPTPFPASGDPVGESESFTWALSSEESSRLTVRARAGGGVIGDVAEPVIRECLARAADGETLVVFVPVNLRPPASRWLPVGNRIGFILLRYDTPPDAARFKAEFDKVKIHAGYAAVWRRLGFNIKQAVLGREQHPPDLEAPPISVAVNNLGRIDTADLPGAEQIVFLGSNTPLYPVISVQSLGGRTTICARVRRHHGGREQAKVLVDAVRASIMGTEQL